MKIFHTENGKESVYVQMEDIMHLHQSDMPIPASIFTKIFHGIVIVDNSNRFDFVKFDEEHENIDYMLKFLSTIYALKHGKISMPFPNFVQLPEIPKKKPFSIFNIFKRKK